MAQRDTGDRAKAGETIDRALAALPEDDNRRRVDFEEFRKTLVEGEPNGSDPNN